LIDGKEPGAGMDVKTLIGIAVVSIEDGEKVSTVDDVIFDLERKRVIAFRLSRSGLFGGGGNVVAMSDVESIGKDAVMIRNRSRVREEKDERELAGRPDLGKLTSLRVVTQDGAYVGNLATVQIDTKTGSITNLEISGGTLMSVLRRNREVPAAEVVSIGSDVAVIPNRYGPDEEESANSTDKREPEIIQ
jgi:uncharacterized protein YrrD